MTGTDTSLVLASGSPRRKRLLEQLGLTFSVAAPEVDERVRPGEDAGQYVARLALDKARRVMARWPGAVILAADTTVAHRGNILGKPASKQEGVAMLTSLSGAEHLVLTGVAVMSGEREESFTTTSAVTFRELLPAEVAAYWDTGEPRDKAGGYGLQGAGGAFVVSINGSYSNVIGLPLAETVVCLRTFGLALPGHDRAGVPAGAAQAARPGRAQGQQAAGNS